MRELANLAPYGSKASESRGRSFPEQEHPYRTAFQRDRDRIIHSTAFRRMEYKTQVFLPHEGDHFRTRLTHTIEVAQISRTMARCLRVNEDLSEAIALVHDLGHTPFGHAGEDVLDDLLAGQGGFNHNNQSLRVVDLLEQRYPDHPGLNLTYEVREGIVKHETTVKVHRPEFDPSTRSSLEASLVDIADEIAYNAHDIDDGLASGLLHLEDLTQLSIWSLLEQAGGRSLKGMNDRELRFSLVRHLVNAATVDVLEESDRQLSRLGITDLASLVSAPERVARYSPGMESMVKELKNFLRSKLYRHERLVLLGEKARRVIETLYWRLDKQPELMPERYREMLLTEDKPIVIADYIAGMTDRYAERLCSELT
ncbi:MAG: deoxyguanosinetriphosphate triphosphohydrolase [candidate division Zixibacteria bacterium]|nr:deoxyguanosinetriphosphate triphosphohydrolase [candidate division Zixibacteria bacterium]